MLKRISIKHALAAVIGVLLVSGVVLEIEGQFSSNQRAEIRQDWLDFEAQRSEKARLFSVLLANFGYGGLIHDYKNFVLRKRSIYAESAHTDIGAVRAVITQYMNIHTEQEELAALHVLGNTLADYQYALNEAQNRIDDHAAVAVELDSQFQLNDAAAFQALDTLGEVIEGEFGRIGQPGKPRLAAQMRRALGYGGFIHAYKDYILRQDLAYARSAREWIAAARRIAEEWRQFPLTQAESIALQDLNSVLWEYEKALDTAGDLFARGKPVEEVDRAVVIDDYPATRALSALDREIVLSIARQLKHVEEQVETATTLAQIKDWTTRGLIAALVLFAGFVLYFMVIRPLGRIERAMADLADGDLSIDIPGADQNNEIGRMARAISVFKETAAHLQQSKEELQVTVYELTDTQYRLQDQATALADMAETLELERQRVEQLSITDRLTNLYNRQKLDAVLAEEMDRAQRYGHPLSLILFDIDHFKSVNDTHGHLVGDDVLIAMANVLKKTIRSVDIAGRWGGEEFIVICPSTDQDGCAEVAEKVRTAIENTDFTVVGRKTASFGIAEFSKQDTVKSVIQRADDALYSAKQRGRNRIELAA